MILTGYVLYQVCSSMHTYMYEVHMKFIPVLLLLLYAVQYIRSLMMSRRILLLLYESYLLAKIFYYDWISYCCRNPTLYEIVTITKYCSMQQCTVYLLLLILDILV